MKRSFYLLGMLLSGGVALAQQDAEGRVGINTSNPVASLDISRNEALLKDAETQKQAQGVSFPNFSTEERSKFENVAVGTMIFNTDKQCLEMYFGLKGGRAHWDCIPNATSAQSQNVAIVPAGFEGVYVAGVPFTGANKVKFELQNNGFSPISNVNFARAVSLQNGGASIGIKGGENKSISLQAGSKTTLSYTLTGTPEEGVLMANFNHLGLTADQQAQVGLGSASVANKDNYTVSLYYQPTNTVVPGKINNGAEKVTIKIPYTNGKGSYNAVNINNIRTAPGQGGDVNNLSLSIPAGNFGVKGELTATIKVEGDGEYLVKQMAPGEQYVIATFPIDMNGTRYDVVLKGIGGIPDRCFGKTTLECVGYGANVKEHEFIYVPIEGPDGRTWLNNNLGAEYANINSPHFNPAQGAKSLTDENAYGSLFQWGRKPDGHELMNWKTSTHGTPANPSLQWKSDSQLKSFEDPCPAGYHTPTTDELRALHLAVTGTLYLIDDPKFIVSNGLNLTVAGYRSYTVAVRSGSTGRYMSRSEHSGIERTHCRLGFSTSGKRQKRIVGQNIILINS
ncbi:hypothetical protein [Ornithobacterium rhinotracheale]|uniref:hypothetical protein n=1 Tax=Ornithobacterium rhinotracheale TaxID=28251 RepID=UPI0039FBCB5B